jgi:two-component system, NtrC family, sensor histidine kinase HydH
MPRGPGLEELRRDFINRFLGHIFAVRLIFVPLAVLVLSTAVITDAAPWRIAALGAIFTVLSVLSVVELLRHRRGEVGPAGVWANLLAMAFLQAGAIVVTGGVESPIAPAMSLLTVWMVLFAPARVAAAGVGLQLGVVLVVTLLQGTGHADALIPEPIRSPGAPRLMTWARGAFLFLVVNGAAQVGRRLRRAVEEIAGSALAARDESLESLAGEARTLTRLAGEIAHELRNPLSSVKGLAQLIARDMPDRSAERMAVLREEVDRMQLILEEFLNFSRPLTPLSVEEVSLSEVANEVALLHESAASERDAQIRVEAPQDVRVKGDRRKLKQILVNLVQNALAVTPPRGKVTISTARDDGGLRLRVRDQGPGLDPAIADHVFEAGATTKAGGSGLGLTVSRSLARQHGGDLSLVSSDGGCVAELILPIAT